MQQNSFELTPIYDKIWENKPLSEKKISVELRIGYKYYKFPDGNLFLIPWRIFLVRMENMDVQNTKSLNNFICAGIFERILFSH